MKRILIITDSLGMPRPNISIEKVWVRKFIKGLGQKFEIFTFCRRSNDTKDLKNFLKDYTDWYKPDFIIIQLGIVDCARRAMPSTRLWFKILSRITFISNVLRKLASKYHFLFSKIFDYQICNITEFENNLIVFVEKTQNFKVIFLPIASPGEFLKKKCYNIENDIKAYNEVLGKISRSYDNVELINPYYGYKSDEYVLKEDGHHLNEFGNKLVFDKLYDFFKQN